MRTPVKTRPRIHFASLLAVAASGAAAVPARADVDLIADGQVGPAFLTRSRSHAIGHAFKPAARLGLRAAFTPRLELGGAVSGIVDGNEHYRVVGGLAHARLAVWKGPVFSTGVGAALGAGNDADILHTDLRATSTVRPYGFLALDARWTVADRWLVGLEAGWEDLAILRVGVTLGVRWHWRASATAPEAEGTAG